MFQLMQMYKQYQGLNDQQGMARVRDQLNLLVSAQQKILSAQNAVAKADGEASMPTSSSGSLSSQLAAPSKSVSVGSNREATLQQHHQQQANQILTQLAAVTKSSPQQTSSLAWQDDGGADFAPPAYSGATTGGSPSGGLSSSTRVTSTVAEWQSGRVPTPPLYNEASVATTGTASIGSSGAGIDGGRATATSNLMQSRAPPAPSLLGHMGSGSPTTTTTVTQNDGEIISPLLIYTIV